METQRVTDNEEVEKEEEEEKKGFWNATETVMDIIGTIWMVIKLVGKGIRFLFSHL